MSETIDTQEATGRIEIPEHYSAKYSEEDKAAVKRILTWLHAASQGDAPKTGSSVASLARAAGINANTLYQSLSGRYTGSPSKPLNAAMDYIAREESRSQSYTSIPFVATSVYKTVTLVCTRAHKHRNFGIVSGVVGVGKTLALKRYAATHPSAIFVQGLPEMSPGSFLRATMKAASVPTRTAFSYGVQQDMLEAIINHLSDSDRLLIVDEAEKVRQSTLEYVRRIADLAEIGCVLSGTEALQLMVRNPIGRHGQISSRVGFWPPIIKGITRDDCAEIVRQALAHLDDSIPNTVIDAFWENCEAKARVLGFLLVNVAELVGSGKHGLSANLVTDVATQLMSINRRRTA